MFSLVEIHDYTCIRVMCSHMCTCTHRMHMAYGRELSNHLSCFKVHICFIVVFQWPRLIENSSQAHANLYATSLYRRTQPVAFLVVCTYSFSMLIVWSSRTSSFVLLAWVCTQGWSLVLSSHVCRVFLFFISMDKSVKTIAFVWLSRVQFSLVLCGGSAMLSSEERYHIRRHFVRRENSFVLKWLTWW